MKKQILCTLAFGLTISSSVMAQTALCGNGSKMSTQLERLVKQATAAKARGISASQPEEFSILIDAKNAEALEKELQAEGFDVTAIDDNILSATLTAAQIQQLATRNDINIMQVSRKFRPLLKQARHDIGADKVQAGTNLDTPFDGTGVLIGVIDQGFYPKHLAFTNAKNETRVKMWWRRGAKPTSANPTTVLPNQGDGLQAQGHATHVANIAGGRNLGNDLQGIAPAADLYFISSSFDEKEMLEDVRAIAQYAQQKKQPFVVNMSLGAQSGPHDGTTTYDRTMDRLFKRYNGVLVAAAGNEGEDPIHTYHKFTADNQSKSFLVKTPDSPNRGNNTLLIGQCWETIADGQKHVTFRPFYYYNGRKTYLTDSQISTLSGGGLGIDDDIDQNNNKHFFSFVLNSATIESIGGSDAQFGVELTGQKDAEVHCWMEVEYGEFDNSAGGFLRGDSKYLSSEGGANVPSAISVAAYTLSTRFTNSEGSTYSLPGYTPGRIAKFSSPGPWLGDSTIMKPTIAAPGTFILSAFNQYDHGLDDLQEEVTHKLVINGKTYYYGAMNGTSMATPVVTGTIALWMQANPKLTSEQIVEILKKTARHDRYTGNDTWTPTFGYGKLDAYEGLKMALTMDNSTGINPVEYTNQPVTINMKPEAWNILFNSDENFAHIAIYNVSGQLLNQRNLQGISRGQEETISLSGLPAGVYLLNVTTANATVSKKVVVK